MDKTPNLLDTFACEGGATAGYMRAGFRVYAIDLDKTALKRNPAYGIRIGDAVADTETLLNGGSLLFSTLNGPEHVSLSDFDAAHASPPCQFYSRGNAGRVTDWPRLIGPMRELFSRMGVPYIIENVKGALRDMNDPIELCGCMFDLSAIDTDGIQIHMQRIRLFESNVSIAAPRDCDHSAHEWVAGAYGGARRDKYEAKFVRKGGYVPRDKEVVKRLMGIENDMTWKGVFESLPPSYTEYLGKLIRSFM